MYKENIDEVVAGWAIRYFHQDISEDEMEKLNQWLQESVENKDLFFHLKNIHDSICYQSPQSAEEAEKSWQKMETKMASSNVYPKNQVPRKKVVFNSLKYIAVASVIGFIVNWYDTIQQKLPPSPLQLQEVRYHEMHVPKGGNPSNITLADGTNIQLNVAGTIRYPENFSITNREVFLDGEAFFDVVEDDKNPFIVHLQHQTIMVYGTSFNVEAYPDESIHKVTLLSGSLSLETLGSKGERISHLLLKPGQKAYFDINTGIVNIEKIDTAIADIWKKGEYKFKDEKLESIVKRIEKYYDIKINLDDDLKNIRYTGTLSFNQNLRQVLDIINYDKKYNFQQNGNTIHIAKK